MKNFLLVFTTFFLTNIAFAQIEQLVKNGEEKSGALLFSERAGSLIVSSYYSLGSVGKLGMLYKPVVFEVILFEDVISNEKEACMRLTVTSENTLYYGYLDADEIDACIKSIKFIRENTLLSKPRIETKCEYKSRAGVRFGARYQSSNWRIYIQSNVLNNSIVRFDDINEILSLENVFIKAKGKIDELIN